MGLFRDCPGQRPCGVSIVEKKTTTNEAQMYSQIGYILMNEIPSYIGKRVGHITWDLFRL